MRGGRWTQKPIVMRQGDRAPVEVFPTYITAAPYLEGIQWGHLGTPEEAASKAELSRMLGIYQAFSAVQQPIKERDGRTIWEVRFPPGCRWKNGPAQPLAWLAIVENYVRNDRFKGYLANGKPAPIEGLIDLGAVVDRSLEKDKQHFDALRHDAVERFKHVTQENA